eukprot:2369626-Pyramimonas_sp.AAC.1
MLPVGLRARVAKSFERLCARAGVARSVSTNTMRATLARLPRAHVEFLRKSSPPTRRRRHRRRRDQSVVPRRRSRRP